MTINLLLLLTMMVSIGAGIYLILDRSLTRIILGIVMLGNGVNILLLLTSGKPGMAPFYDKAKVPADFSDPLPQAMILTSIVITLSVVAIMLALTYRAWMIVREDILGDDTEDLRVTDTGGYYDEVDEELLDKKLEEDDSV
ncbi:MAG: NADH-quinone oxidoreductase subunit K [Micrococcaceae bacterium]